MASASGMHEERVEIKLVQILGRFLLEHDARIAVCGE
jgi:hypothetical protein